MGAAVALVEKHRLGGDCLNTGCVPSKALLSSAAVAAVLSKTSAYGISANPAEISTHQVMEWMWRVRAGLAAHDSAKRFQELGVDVFFGSAHFSSSQTVQVAGADLHFAKAIIATGSRPALPDIQGLSECAYWTSETFFEVPKLPARLAIIGAGPMGCELAQALARLGVEVHLLNRQPRPLPREIPEAPELVARSLARDGVQCWWPITNLHVAQNGSQVSLHFATGDRKHTLHEAELLLATGRSPNVQSLGLEMAGVEFSEKGIRVDDYLRTTNPRVFAAGDVCLPYHFTHVADQTARLAVQNALFPIRRRWTSLVIPWCTYTDPEVAHTGWSPTEARRHGVEVETVEEPLAVDKAVLDGRAEGFLRLYLQQGRDRLLGATVVGPAAGELASELTLAIQNGIGLKKLGDMIRPYPTYSEIIRRAADQWRRKKLTPAARKLLSSWFRAARWWEGEKW